jgi:hypothetical protein
MKLSSILLGFLVVSNSVACKPRLDNGSGVKQVTPVGSSLVRCKFDMPEENSTFSLTAALGADALTQISSELKKNNAPSGDAKQIDRAPIAQPTALDEMWDKKLRDQKNEDRSIRAYEKDLFRVDRNNYTCFDISGVGPKSEDYFCMHKSMQVGSAQALWISNYRYAKDLNVINVTGSSCLAKN